MDAIQVYSLACSDGWDVTTQHTGSPSTSCCSCDYAEVFFTIFLYFIRHMSMSFFFAPFQHPNPLLPQGLFEHYSTPPFHNIKTVGMWNYRRIPPTALDGKYERRDEFVIYSKSLPASQYRQPPESPRQSSPKNPSFRACLGLELDQAQHPSSPRILLSW